jgi:ribonuclease HI
LDGAFYSRENAGATGAFLHAKAEWRNHVSGAMTMEVLALKEGLILARQMGVRRICSETDCVEVVHL